MINKTEILVVDDEPQIQRLLGAGLEGFDYRVSVAVNGQEAIMSVARQKPEIVVLDIDLGSYPDGLEVCSELRKWTTTPIIMLTVNNDKRTRLAALNAGADDYITKPFDMEELEARIRAILRRAVMKVSNSVSDEIHVHDLVIDLAKRRIMLKGNEVHLVPTEYRLLRALATHPGKVLTFTVLMEEIRGASESAKPKHYLQVYINTLRKKLHDDPATRTTKPLYIFSEPGIGYRFTDIESDDYE